MQRGMETEEESGKGDEKEGEQKAEPTNAAHQTIDKQRNQNTGKQQTQRKTAKKDEQKRTQTPRTEKGTPREPRQRKNKRKRKDIIGYGYDKVVSGKTYLWIFVRFVGDFCS